MSTTPELVYYERCVFCGWKQEPSGWHYTANNKPCPDCARWGLVHGSRFVQEPALDSTGDLPATG